jgi:predicted house-cleaning NTP pyrophosphatase (Maf/HAM1 superfamily)
MLTFRDINTTIEEGNAETKAKKNDYVTKLGKEKAVEYAKNMSTEKDPVSPESLGSGSDKKNTQRGRAALKPRKHVRVKDILNAKRLDDKFRKEEAENLQELSTKTKRSYIKAAVNDKSDADYHAGKLTGKGIKNDNQDYPSTADTFKKASINSAIRRSEKRTKGINTAASKLGEDFQEFFNAVTEHLDLTEEELAELSKATLSSYLRKAETSAMKDAKKGNRHLNAAYAAKFDGDEAGEKNHRDKAKLHHDKSDKRISHITTADTKLREDFQNVFDAMVEHLDLSDDDLQELSNATLGRYIGKATTSSRKEYRQANTHMNAAAAATGTNRPADAKELRAKAVPHYKKSDKRNNNILTAVKKMNEKDFDTMFDAMTEHLEIEGDLQELKKTTLASYVKKANNQSNFDAANSGIKTARGDFEGAKKFGAKTAKRERGISNAADKLAKEDIDLTEDEYADRAKEDMRKHKENKANLMTSARKELEAAMNKKKAERSSNIYDRIKSKTKQAV